MHKIVEIAENRKESTVNHEKRLEDAIASMGVSIEKLLMCVDDEAEDLRAEANQLIVEVGQKGFKTGGLRLTVRYRLGRWGPDISWIRVPLKKSPNSDMIAYSDELPKRYRFSKVVALHGNRSVRRRIFAPLGDILPDRLNEIEDKCVRLRVTIDMLRKCMASIKELSPETAERLADKLELAGIGQEGNSR